MGVFSNPESKLGSPILNFSRPGAYCQISGDLTKNFDKMCISASTDETQSTNSKNLSI